MSARNLEVCAATSRDLHPQMMSSLPTRTFSGRLLVRVLVLLVALGVAAVLTGCSSGGGASTAPKADPTIKVEVPKVSVDTNQGGSDNKGSGDKGSDSGNQGSSTSSNSSSSGGGIQTWVWVLLGILVVAVVAIALNGSRRRRDRASQPATSNNPNMAPAAAAPVATSGASPVNEILSRGNWIVGQGVPALLNATTPNAAQTAWSSLDGALSDVSSGVSQLEGRVQGQEATNLNEVRDAVSGLRMAAHSDAEARMSGNASGAPAANDQAVTTASQRLSAALNVFSAPPAS